MPARTYQMPELAQHKKLATIKYSEKEQAFIREYMVEGRGTDSAINAGYSPKSAALQAWKLLKKPIVKAAIAELQRQRAIRTNVTADRILAEMGKMAVYNVKDLFHPDGTPKHLMDIPDDLAAAVQEVTVKVSKKGITTHSYKMVDKLKAINDLAKHFGLFAPLQVNVQHDYSGLSDGQLANEIKQLREKLGDVIEQVPGDDGVLIDVTPEVAPSHGADTCGHTVDTTNQTVDNANQTDDVATNNSDVDTTVDTAKSPDKTP